MPKKIKVTILINDFLVGGAQRLIIDLLTHLNREKFDLVLVTLFSFSGKKNMYAQVPENTRVFKFKFSGFRDIRSWFQLAAFLKAEKPDFVVSNLFFGNTVSRILRPFLGYKAISVEHNTYIYKPGWQVILDYFLAFFSSRIIAVSETVRTFTIKQEKINPERFITIHNGIDVAEIDRFVSSHGGKDEMRKVFGFSANERIFLNVGRLTPQKNQQLLVRSFAAFAANQPGYKLVILGEGSLMPELQSLVRELGLGDQVFLFGARENIYDYYLISDYFVSTSIIEGLSIAYLEALAFGLPLLVTKTAGTDEIVKEGKNGRFLWGSDHLAIAREIENFTACVWKPAEIRETARRFDIRRTVEKYEQLIYDLDSK